MNRFALIGYRNWSYEIFKNLNNFQKKHPFFSIDTLITTPESEFNNETRIRKYYVVKGSDNKKIYKILKKNKIDVALCYGWSWIIKEPLLSDFICLCLHPAPLPKYRGGTPIQHQILNEEIKSAVTIFKMAKGIDNGDIYTRIQISLKGNIKDIFSRMVAAGTKATKKFILDFEKDKLIFTPQKELTKNPPWKRRKLEQSEVKLDDLKNMTFLSLYNFVRALTEPYPNAYILLKNKKIYLQAVRKYPKPKKGSIILDVNTNIKKFDKAPLYLKLKDSYALIRKYTLIEV
jgi:methionyl-tRNA formyltransferase